MRPLLALSIAAFAAAPVAAQGSQNVLVILADDLGVDVVGAYGEGSAPPNTPTIDGLAARGILFRNAYAYPSCSPTRAAILTGRYPFRTLVGRWIRHPNNSGPAIGTLRASEWTLPEMLEQAGTGHAHACIGKWHMHDATFPVTVPQILGGFAHFTGFLAGQLPNYYAWPRVAGGVEQNTSFYATTQQTDDAIAWIQGQTGPWVCYLAYNAPHIPFHVPPAHLHTRNITGASSNREKYKAMIEAMDTEIGRLLSALGPRLANTHVIFLGDNGSVQNMAQPPFLPGRAKGTPYEGGINVPLIYAGPATVSPGREVTALACAVDVFATAVELAGATQALPPWVASDGVSLVPYLGNPNRTPLRTFAFSEQFTGDRWPAPNLNGHAIVRNDRYKLIHRYSGGAHELYDLVADPWESTNLLGRALTPAEQQNYAALLNEVGRLRSPRGRCVPFGIGACAGSAGTPVMSCVGAPRFGSTFRLGLSGAPASTPVVLATGLSHTEWLGQRLPIDLVALGGGPGCAVQLSLEATRLAVTDGAGAASLPFTVPNLPALMEVTLLHGWFVLDRSAPGNSLGVVNTHPLAAVTGL